MVHEAQSHIWFQSLTADATNNLRYLLDFAFREKAHLLPDGSCQNSVKEGVCQGGLGPPNTSNLVNLAEIKKINPSDLLALLNHTSQPVFMRSPQTTYY